MRAQPAGGDAPGASAHGAGAGGGMLGTLLLRIEAARKRMYRAAESGSVRRRLVASRVLDRLIVEYERARSGG